MIQLAIVAAVLFTMPAWPESTAELLERLDAAAPSFTGATASNNQFQYHVANTGNVRSYALRAKAVELNYPKTNTIQPYDLRKYRDIAQRLMLLGFGMAGRVLAVQYDMRNLGTETVDSESTTHVLDGVGRPGAAEVRSGRR